MIEQDTIKLLRECDAGVKMGVLSIEDVLPHVKNSELEKVLTKCKDEHDKLNTELQELLNKSPDEGKDPNPIAKGMSWVKTERRLLMILRVRATPSWFRIGRTGMQFLLLPPQD